MGQTGVHIGESKLLPITGTISDWETRTAKAAAEGIGEGKIEVAALYDANGNPIIGFQGDRHSVGIPERYLDAEGATFTHLHPDDRFGGTLSMTDLRTFAQSKWKELRAVSKQGQLYRVTAGPNANREGLAHWVQVEQKLFQRNFESSYKKALKESTTVLKSGPHKGQVKLSIRERDPKTGKTISRTEYRAPMTPQQADRYARQKSVGTYERSYRNALSKFGFTYEKTKSRNK